MLISWTVVKLNYGKNKQDMSDIELFWTPLRKEQYLKNKVDIDLPLFNILQNHIFSFNNAKWLSLYE